MADIVDRGARKVKSSAPLRTAARVGYAVNGIVHALIGVTAISVTFGPGGECDQSGALGELAAAPDGRLLLWIIVIALFAPALWQLANAWLERGIDRNRRWAHWIGDLAKAVVYVLVGMTSLTFALGSSSSTSASS